MSEEFTQTLEKIKLQTPRIIKALRDGFSVLNGEHTQETFPAFRNTQITHNQLFIQKLKKIWEGLRKNISPYISYAMSQDLLIQHILTEKFWQEIASQTPFYRQNPIFQELQELQNIFLTEELQEIIFEDYLTDYQLFINIIKEELNVQIKKDYIRLFISEINRFFFLKKRQVVSDLPSDIHLKFMLRMADVCLEKHFGKKMNGKNLEILDPQSINGDLLWNLIDYLPKEKIKNKFSQEIHASQSSLLDYYFLHFQMEWAYQLKTLDYQVFTNLVWQNHLLNLNFGKQGEQVSLFGLRQANDHRIQEQNQKKISLILSVELDTYTWLKEINTDYKELGNKLKISYLKTEIPSKNKSNFHFLHFCRWASERIENSGMIGILTSRNFVEDLDFSGFRKSIEEEFDYVYVIDHLGNKAEWVILFLIKLDK